MTTDPLREAQVAEIMAAHALFWPPPTDAADPSDEWVAEAWAARSSFEEAVRTALAAQPEPLDVERLRAALTVAESELMVLRPIAANLVENAGPLVAVFRALQDPTP